MEALMNVDIMPLNVPLLIELRERILCEMARKIKESLTRVTIVEAPARGFTTVLMQALVGPTCAPAILKGMRKRVPTSASHRIKKNKTTYFSRMNTALTRRKKRREVEPMANVKQNPSPT